ncbi:MAG: YciL protein [Devosia sp.]|nr:YciL protein [Devosia sp.]
MLFAFVGYDKPNGLAHRMEVRPEHLKHLDTLGDKLILAGPFLDDKGDMNGSFMVIEAESLDAAKGLYGSDPFVREGVFASFEVRPWKLGVNNTKAG